MITATVTAQQVIPTTPNAPVNTTKSNRAETGKAIRPPQKPEDRLRHHWLERAHYLTAQLEEDSARMKNFRDALLMGRIGQAWWPVDQNNALSYLNKAASSVESASQNESADAANTRFDVIQTLLAATIRLEPNTPPKKQLHDRLFRVLLSAAIHFADSPGDKSNAKQLNSIRNALFRIAAESASERRLDDAIPATSALMRLPGSQVSPLINIYLQDPKRGEALFNEGIKQARSSGEVNLIATLMDIAFPAHNLPTKPTPDMQGTAAQLYADVIMRALSTPEQKQRVCFLTSRASQVVPHLPPALAGQVNTALSSCKDAIDRTFAMLNEAESLHLDTADDYMKAAADEPSIDKRAALKQQAYFKALESQNGLQALEILRSTTPDEKQKQMETSEDWVNAAYLAIRQLQKTRDFRGIDRVIDEVPDEYRGGLLVSYAQTLSSERDKDTARLLNVLRQARKELEEHKSCIDQDYPLLLVTYNKVDPSQTLGLLTTVVKGLNQYTGDTMEEAMKNKKNYHFRLVDSLEPMPNTGLALIDFDEGTVDAAIKQLDSPDYRIVFRLGLLMASLRREAGEHPLTPEPQSQQRHAAVTTPANGEQH
jgi:hypothetical protein